LLRRRGGVVESPEHSAAPKVVFLAALELNHSKLGARPRDPVGRFEITTAAGFARAPGHDLARSEPVELVRELVQRGDFDAVGLPRHLRLDRELSFHGRFTYEPNAVR